MTFYYYNFVVQLTFPNSVFFLPQTATFMHVHTNYIYPIKQFIFSEITAKPKILTRPIYPFILRNTEIQTQNGVMKIQVQFY